MVFFSYGCDDKTPRGRMRTRAFIGALHAAMKKARGGFARAFDAVSVNTEFLEDSVTRSQAFCRARAQNNASTCKEQEKNRDQGAHVP
ncbi:MAG TPA: hypothetical protein VE801_00770 [Xanthobacteraceae bacterium]|jgi:hypothetical protein|nr:hypothetical protein [Xanthobacteraceae bacterium]